MENKKLNVKEIMIEHDVEDDIVSDKLNLICSPCGSGKTIWSINYIKRELDNKSNVIFISDSCLNVIKVKSQIQEYLCKFEGYQTNTMYHMCDYDKVNDHIIYQCGEVKCLVANFNYVSCYLIHHKEFLDDYDVIVFDELHDIFWRDNCKTLIDFIPTLAKDDRHTVIAMSATPRLIYGHYREYKDLINDLLKSYRDKNLIKKHSTKSTMKVMDIKDIDFNLLQDKRFLVYTTKVSEQIELKQLFARHGFTTDFICSNQHKEYVPSIMDNIKNHLLETGRIPNNLDGLIINKSACTGLDFEGIDIVIVNSPDNDIITQVRGRARGNIELLISITDEEDKAELLSEQSFDIENDLIEYLNRPLFKDEQKELLNLIHTKYGIGKSKTKPYNKVKDLIEDINNCFDSNYNYNVESKKWRKRNENYNSNYIEITK